MHGVMWRDIRSCDFYRNLNLLFSRNFIQVFQNQKGSSDSSVQNVAESILRFFSGFEAFQLPPPSSDPKVLENIAGNKSKLSPAFMSGVQKFKPLLKSVLITKQSFNDGDIVTGEGMYEIFRVGNDLLVSWNLFIKLRLHGNSSLDCTLARMLRVLFVSHSNPWLQVKRS